MSLRILKPGLYDSIQDLGRWGYQHSGVTVGGAMDRFSAQLANALLGKELNAPVIEMHFPAPVIRFEASSVICLSGADFSPSINGESLPLCQPVMVGKGAELKCTTLKKGARCYLSIVQDLELDIWLGSYSTATNIGIGGYKGRLLQKEDIIPFRNGFETASLLKGKDWLTLPWKTEALPVPTDTFHFIIGNEWKKLPITSQTLFLNTTFTIAAQSNRIGYRLTGTPLLVKESINMISTAVSFGTIQLLPNGQLIVLMADHQTTGGYPRIGHVISAHLSYLAQVNPHETIRFSMTTQKEAEEKSILQQQYLLRIQNACKFKMEKLLYAAH